jgi:hypothetical protein
MLNLLIRLSASVANGWHLLICHGDDGKGSFFEHSNDTWKNR